MRVEGNEINGFVISSLLTACSRADDMVHEGFQVHCLVMQIGLLDDVALAACSTSGFVAEGKIVHALVFTAGLQDNRIVGNALVTMYGKCGMMCYAKQVFQRMPEKESVTWNALIGGYAENEEPDLAIQLFMLMRKRGEPTNYITVVNVLGACSAPKELLKHGMPLHALIVLTGFESENYVKNSLITMYAKCGDLKSSNYLFNGLVNKNSVAWNAMVAANGHHGHWEETLRLFAEMQRVGVGFDQFSLSVALAASANLANLEEGQLLHSSAMKLGFASYLYVANAIMDMYGKCGEIDDVLKMLPEPKVRPQLSWNILISAFARHGSFRKARETFHEMVGLGLKPNHVTFVSLLSACSHGGLVDDGLAYFASMTKDFGVPAGIEHCVCMVDLLGRSGRLSEAEAFIKEMPTPPNDFVWRSLLAACRIHGNLELGRKAAEHLLKSDPSDDSAYVLYSNVYATRGRWEDAQNVWREMKSNNIKKQPAWSWLTAGHLYAKLGSLEDNQRSIASDTSFVLLDADEEQTEFNQWNHSKRLPIFKNLRVDCIGINANVRARRYIDSDLGRTTTDSCKFWLTASHEFKRSRPKSLVKCKFHVSSPSCQQCSG
ncbi:hypothetical protein RJ639_011788 [Escallonia herrerae]|uniref:Pentatricopeptide repeat-containing protein n=1 Tax=Escallonia herrerae TaxID=1293975 RepID=A0AA88VJI2_9ASTE|nr:hypothetical protein RJ639_011788 [Escallonia herrerae]